MGKSNNSGISKSPGSPQPASYTLSLSAEAVGDGDRARQRTAIRDTQIRKGVTLSLAKRSVHADKISIGTGDSPTSSSSLPPSHTVSHYELSPIETIPESNTVLEAVRHMAARHLDSLLVLDVSGTRLRGIITDQDVTFRVLAAGMDPRTATVAQVMTPDPRTIPAGTSIIEALTVMVANHFRHLPVVSESHNSNDSSIKNVLDSSNSSGSHKSKDDDNKIHATNIGRGDLLGVLDIAKCLKDALQKLELADAAASQIASAMDAVRAIRGNFTGRDQPAPVPSRSSPYPLTTYSSPLETLRERLACPRISSLLRPERASGCTIVSAQGTTVEEAIRAMAQRQHTAAVVINEQDHLIGIFTTKDVLLRVIAAGLDPATTSIVRVMTPHPDWTSPEQSIISALRQMHLGRFLHLPVVRMDMDVGQGGSSSSISSVSARKSLLGVVDVLQLTYAMLEQLNQLSHGAEDTAAAPLWHQLWSPSPVGDERPRQHEGRYRQGEGTELELLARTQEPPVSLLDKEEEEEEFTNLSASILIKICYGGPKGRSTGNGPREVFLLPIENVFELPRLEMVLQEACCRLKFPVGASCRLALVDEDGDVIPLGEDEEFIKVIQFAMGSGRDRITLTLLTDDFRSGHEDDVGGTLITKMTLVGMATALLFALGCWFLRSRT